MPNVFVPTPHDDFDFEKFLKIFVPLCTASIIFFLALAIFVSF